MFAIILIACLVAHIVSLFQRYERAKETYENYYGVPLSFSSYMFKYHSIQTFVVLFCIGEIVLAAFIKQPVLLVLIIVSLLAVILYRKAKKSVKWRVISALLVVFVVAGSIIYVVLNPGFQTQYTRATLQIMKSYGLENVQVRVKYYCTMDGYIVDNLEIRCSGIGELSYDEQWKLRRDIEEMWFEAPDKTLLFRKIVYSDGEKYWEI